VTYFLDFSATRGHGNGLRPQPFPWRASSSCRAALSELARQGLAACDGFAGLRALSARVGRHQTREPRAAHMAAAGRWSLTGNELTREASAVIGNSQG
jgi:hypothetical protein